jgi:hypothetical protein
MRRTSVLEKVASALCLALLGAAGCGTSAAGPPGAVEGGLEGTDRELW